MGQGVNGTSKAAAVPVSCASRMTSTPIVSRNDPLRRSRDYEYSIDAGVARRAPSTFRTMKKYSARRSSPRAERAIAILRIGRLERHTLQVSAFFILLSALQPHRPRIRTKVLVDAYYTLAENITMPDEVGLVISRQPCPTRCCCLRSSRSAAIRP